MRHLPALRALVAQAILAQDGNADASGESERMVIEEVVTTGVRRSLIASLDRKRDAVGVVDVITAEEIGKLPRNRKLLSAICCRDESQNFGRLVQ